MAEPWKRDEKLAEKQRACSKKKKEDLKKLAEKGVYLTPGHVVKPGTLVRVIDIAEQIANGKSRMKVIEYIRNKYGIEAEADCDNYYNMGLAYLLPKDIEQHSEKMAAKLISQYENLYEKAVDRENIKVAKDILDSMAKLYGLVGGNKVQMAENANGERVIQITFD